jgi:hypothetical protein
MTTARFIHVTRSTVFEGAFNKALKRKESDSTGNSPGRTLYSLRNPNVVSLAPRIINQFQSFSIRKVNIVLSLANHNELWVEIASWPANLAAQETRTAIAVANQPGRLKAKH